MSTTNTKPLSSKEPSSNSNMPSTSARLSLPETEIEASDHRAIECKKRKTALSSATSVTMTSGRSSSSELGLEWNASFSGPLLIPLKISAVICSICMESMKEPTVINCGHTYCHTCINKLIMQDCHRRCPKCLTCVCEDNLAPNHALNDIMARTRQVDFKAVKSEVLEACVGSHFQNSTGSPTNVTKLLSDGNYDKLSLNDLDNLISVVRRKREIKAVEDGESKRKLLQEFLSQLLKVKQAQIEKLQREVLLINWYQLISDTSSDDVNNGIVGITEDVVVESSSSSSEGQGYFNTHHHSRERQVHQSLAAMKMRMYNHFDELVEVYLEARKAETFNDADAASDAKDAISVSFGDLENFEENLIQITKYHGLKPLATISCGSDLFSKPAPRVVSDIDFDKDAEFFAVGGEEENIKIFEYGNMIANAWDGHYPCTKINCNNEVVSCVAWNKYCKNTLASSGRAGFVSIWDVGASSRVLSLMEHKKRVWSVDWSNCDTRLLISGSEDNKIKLWSTNTNHSVATLKANDCIHGVKFSPESSYLLAFGSGDQCVYYYDMRNTKKSLASLSGHQKPVSHVNFMSNDELVSASTDGTLKSWDLCRSTMSSVRSYKGHINQKHFLRLATEGDFIACGSENNSLYLYHKLLQKPLFSFKFDIQSSIVAGNDPLEAIETQGFVSAVAWKKDSPVMIAGNSRGVISILELV